MFATALHLLLEAGPLLSFFTTLLLTDHGLGIVAKLFLFTLCSIWYFAGVLILHKLGLTKPLFGMEMGTGLDKGMALNRYAQVVIFVAQMDSPEDIEQLRQRMHDHFVGKYPRCSTEVAHVRSNVFFRPVDAAAVKRAYRVHDTALSKEQLEDMAAK